MAQTEEQRPSDNKWTGIYKPGYPDFPEFVTGKASFYKQEKFSSAERGKTKL